MRSPVSRICNSPVKSMAFPCVSLRSTCKALRSIRSKVRIQSMRNLWALLVACCLSLAAANVLAQDVLTKGMVGGTVTDAAGAAVPGARIVVTGQTGERTGTTNENGIFRVENLEPGTYT